jgi:hypothetical protein
VTRQRGSRPLLEADVLESGRPTRWAVRWLAELELSEAQAYAVFVACSQSRLEQSVVHLALQRVHQWEREHGYCFIRPRSKQRA